MEQGKTTTEHQYRGNEDIVYDNYINIDTVINDNKQISDKEREINKTVEVAQKHFKGTFYDNAKLNITVNEVGKVLKSLKNNKASGLDNIEYEHLKYGGNSLRNHMTKLFNLVCYNFYSPKSLKSSLIVPLFKGGNKCKGDPNSYRGISLAPCIGKVFDKIIDSKLELKKDNKCFPNPQQTAYQQCLSCLHTSFNIHESLYHHLERLENIIVVLLDSTKAFDTV
ncbi:unnamed protein product [Mytilus coruscus]|uniref:Reverse transcriptase domain-containing protein n=1 Tax=Mytilus coruscus TaxID=42192 RepID=A0A6J8E9W0_MYTCO|nr:unnamed protein product [Mytilus coruscus]